MELHLSDADGQLLRELLQHELDELRREIAATDRKDFRLTLREREALLERVLDQLVSRAGPVGRAG